MALNVAVEGTKYSISYYEAGDVLYVTSEDGTVPIYVRDEDESGFQWKYAGINSVAAGFISFDFKFIWKYRFLDFLEKIEVGMKVERALAENLTKVIFRVAGE